MNRSTSEVLREYIQLLENQSLVLPPIPDEYVRLTHFTDHTITKKIIDTGDVFKIEGQLPSTTDAFTNNNEIINLIKTGSYAVYTRSRFGDSVLLMDLSYDEHKKMQFVWGPIPIVNARILGYVDRETLNFTKNPNYDPTSTQPLRTGSSDRISAAMQKSRDGAPAQQQSQPQPTGTRLSPKDIDIF